MGMTSQRLFVCLLEKIRTIDGKTVDIRRSTKTSVKCRHCTTLYIIIERQEDSRLICTFLGCVHRPFVAYKTRNISINTKTFFY
jgi:hypothetical protein